MSLTERDVNYVPAQTWDGLEWVGGKEWLEKVRDPGDEFVG